MYKVKGDTKNLENDQNNGLLNIFRRPWPETITTWTSRRFIHFPINVFYVVMILRDN